MLRSAIGERACCIQQDTKKRAREPVGAGGRPASQTFEQFRPDLRYERTDTEGPAFDRMKTRLDAVAPQTGMSQTFKLSGLDVYRVLDCTNKETRLDTGHRLPGFKDSPEAGVIFLRRPLQDRCSFLKLRQAGRG